MWKASKFELYFVFLLPIFNALVNVVTNLYKGGLTIGSLRVFVIILFVVGFISRRKLSDVGKRIIFYNLFLIFLLLFASDVYVSSTQVLKVIISMSSFFIYEYYISTRKRYLLFILISGISLFIYNVNLVLSQIFKIGDSTYVEDSFYMGGSSVSGTLAMSLIIIGILPFLRFFVKKIKIFQMINIILSIMFIIVVMRRTSIIILGIGLLLYSICYLKNIKTILSGICIVCIGFLFFNLVFKESYTERERARTEQKERWYGESRAININEGRFTDLTLSFDAMKDNGLTYALIGEDIFDSKSFFRNKRTLHNGYASLLSGTGLIGTFFFVYILFSMLKRRNFYSSHIPKADMFDIALKNQIVIMLLLLVIALFSHRLYDITFIFTSFSYLGATMGCLKSEYKIDMIQKNKIK